MFYKYINTRNAVLINIIHKSNYKFILFSNNTTEFSKYLKEMQEKLTEICYCLEMALGETNAQSAVGQLKAAGYAINYPANKRTNYYNCSLKKMLRQSKRKSRLTAKQKIEAVTAKFLGS
ncbi:hypothetical protein [Bartonella sp. DGB2]|uniref:hypothetical protein n=1 Tax=Bartonella sp. DGB2 TaxID=3388426 RepID=UPI00398FDDFE